jgi:hypothetical protein
MEQQQIPIATITATIPETTPTLPLFTTTPPAKTDIIIDIITERERLKQVRQEIKEGTRRPSKILTADMYLTQLILQADKIALYAIKENILTVNNNTQIDITNQTNALIKVSEEACKNPVAEDTPS